MQILVYVRLSSADTRSPQPYHISIITTHVVITRKICRYNEKRSRYNEKICRFNEKRSRYYEKRSRYNEKKSRYYEKLSRYNHIKNIIWMAVLRHRTEEHWERIFQEINTFVTWTVCLVSLRVGKRITDADRLHKLLSVCLVVETLYIKNRWFKGTHSMFIIGSLACVWFEVINLRLLFLQPLGHNT